MSLPAVRESKVMGRNAVLLLLGLSSTAGIATIVGVDVSGIVASLGDGYFRLTWGITLVLSAVLVGVSVWIKDHEDAAWVEVAGLLAHAIAAGTYQWALWTQAEKLSDTWFVSTYMLAAIGNCLGRSFFLLRQVWWVRRQVRA